MIFTFLVSLHILYELLKNNQVEKLLFFWISLFMVLNKFAFIILFGVTTYFLFLLLLKDNFNLSINNFNIVFV